MRSNSVFSEFTYINKENIVDCLRNIQASKRQATNYVVLVKIYLILELSIKN